MFTAFSGSMCVALCCWHCARFMGNATMQDITGISYMYYALHWCSHLVTEQGMVDTTYKCKPTSQSCTRAHIILTFNPVPSLLNCSGLGLAFML